MRRDDTVSGVTCPSPPHAATSILRHDLPGEAGHFDWLVERFRDAAGIRAGVATFRLPGRLDLAAAGSRLEAVRIADHRRLYLTLDEPRQLSGGRGRVTPCRRGIIARSSDEGGGCRMAIDWCDPGESGAAARSELRLLPAGESRWVAEILSQASRPPLPNTAS